MKTSPSDVSLFPQRVRNALRFRALTVIRTERIAGHFQRIVATGDDLKGFESQGFDDHIKVFFPESGSGFLPPQVSDEGIVWQNEVRPAARDYTPIYDAQANELTIDFYLHDHGVASDWALQAKPGDALFIGGPRGSLVVPVSYAWQLYVCDETGLPALCRRLMALQNSQHTGHVTALVSIQHEEVKTMLPNFPGVNIEWFSGQPETAIAQRVAQLSLPCEGSFIWITGEGQFVKQLGDQVSEGRDPRLVRAVAYWHRKV